MADPPQAPSLSFQNTCNYFALKTSVAISTHLSRREQILAEYATDDIPSFTSTTVSDIYSQNDDLPGFCLARLVELYFDGINIRDAVQNVRREALDQDWENGEFLETLRPPINEEFFLLFPPVTSFSVVGICERGWNFMTSELRSLAELYRRNIPLRYFTSKVFWCFRQSLLLVLAFIVISLMISFINWLLLSVIFNAISKIPIIGPPICSIITWIFSVSWIQKTSELVSDATTATWAGGKDALFYTIGGVSSVATMLADRTTAIWNKVQRSKSTPYIPPEFHAKHTSYRNMGFESQSINTSIHEVVNMTMHLGVLGIGSYSMSELLSSGSRRLQRAGSIARAHPDLSNNVLLGETFNILANNSIGLSEDLGNYQIYVDSLVYSTALRLPFHLERIEKTLSYSNKRSYAIQATIDTAHKIALFASISELSTL